MKNSRWYYQKSKFLAASFFVVVSGGMCWSTMSKEGLCKEMLNSKVSREQCCNGGSVSTAWSSQDLDDGALFFWRVLSDGVPCSPCKETCEGVKCGTGRKCTMRSGRPRCICAPRCKHLKDKAKKGPVCGTDGRSYKSICRLKKRACRTKDTSLSMNYYGLCQNSCKNIRCPAGKYCILDQNLNPHCVKCSHYCSSNAPTLLQRVCGTDGVTYQSVCHLREAACLKGKAIPIAYSGRCRGNATCKNIHCSQRQKCLVERNTGHPRCVSCYECPKRRHLTALIREMGGPICGNNNQTYSSWCHMLRDSCAKGYIIETQFSGTCEIGEANKFSFSVSNKRQLNT